MDKNNTTGFAKNPTDVPMVAIYTAHVIPDSTKPDNYRQEQHIAYSLDNGRTFIKYPGNPVLDIDKKDFRDPKVFWHEPTKKWIMLVVLAQEHIIKFWELETRVKDKQEVLVRSQTISMEIEWEVQKNTIAGVRLAANGNRGLIIGYDSRKQNFSLTEQMQAIQIFTRVSMNGQDTKPGCYRSMVKLVCGSSMIKALWMYSPVKVRST
jgi:sucrose-6-phosphate hydrolase SacC (GH32 family)